MHRETSSRLLSHDLDVNGGNVVSATGFIGLVYQVLDHALGVLAATQQFGEAGVTYHAIEAVAAEKESVAGLHRFDESLGQSGNSHADKAGEL